MVTPPRLTALLSRVRKDCRGVRQPEIDHARFVQRHEERRRPTAPRKAAGAPQKRPVPPDQTNAENFYYVKQMQAKTPMVITLKDGEVIKGVIEWYDRFLPETESGRRAEFTAFTREHQIHV